MNNIDARMHDARMSPVGGVACRPCAALAILQEATVWFTLRSVLGVGLVLGSTRTLVTLVASALAALLPPSGVVAGVAVHCRIFLCCHHENTWKPNGQGIQVATKTFMVKDQSLTRK